MPAPTAMAEQGFASVSRPRYRGSRLLRELSFLGLCLRKLATTRGSECDVIQARDMVSIGLIALIAARLKGIPFCYWVSFLMSEGRIGRARAMLAQRASLRNRLVLWKGLIEHAILYRVVLPRADHVFVQSDAMLAHMVAKGIPAERMTSVPMGVDMELFGAQGVAATRIPDWQASPVLAYLGSMDKERELTTLIDALRQVRLSHPRAGLLLIGAASLGADTDALMEYAAREGLSEAVHLTGWLPSAQAWALLKGADAAVSYVPRCEMYDVSSPTKLLEYLALGMPAVGNDTPDQAHVLGASKAGWLTASDAGELARAALAIFGDLPAARARAAAGPAYILGARSYGVIAREVARSYCAVAGHGNAAQQQTSP